jgi:hypothetical protein
VPTLDDIDVVVRPVGDMSYGMQICDTDVTGGRAGVSTTSGSGKGKEKEVLTGPAPKARSRSPSSDTGASIDQSALPEKKRRLFRSDGTIVGGGGGGAADPN